MEINLFNPPRAVHQSFFKPDLPVAFVLVLLPTIISVIGTIIFGLQFNIVLVAVSIVSSVASWIAMSILLYIIGFVIEGNSLKGKFSGILSALSLLWLVSAIMAIAGLLLAATLPHGIITTVNELQAGQLGATQAYAKMAETVNAAAEQTSLFVLAAFAVVSLALMVLALLIIFLTAKEFSPKSTAKQFTATIVFILAWIIVSGIASTILA